MSLRCRIFGHQWLDLFKHRRCLRCGKTEKKILKGIVKELDANASEILELETDLLLIKARQETI